MCMITVGFHSRCSSHNPGIYMCMITAGFHSRCSSHNPGIYMCMITVGFHSRCSRTRQCDECFVAGFMLVPLNDLFSPPHASPLTSCKGVPETYYTSVFYEVWQCFGERSRVSRRRERLRERFPSCTSSMLRVCSVSWVSIVVRRPCSWARSNSFSCCCLSNLFCRAAKTANVNTINGIKYNV